MDAFPFRRLTIVPLLTAGLAFFVSLFAKVVPDLIHPHGVFVLLLIAVFVVLTLAGLFFVPIGLMQALKQWRSFPSARDSTNLIAIAIGAVYVVAILIAICSFVLYT